MASMKDLLKEMAGEIPGFVAGDIVGVDGVSIAGHTTDPQFNAEGAAAQFALAMKLLGKSVAMLKLGELEDNLLTTEKSFVIVRMLGDGSYYLLIAVNKADANLGNVRLMARQFADALWAAVPKKRV